MRKKSLLALLLVAVLSFGLCMTASAQRQSTFPIKMVSQGSYYNTTSTIYDFDIYYVENLSGQYKNRLWYYFDYSTYTSLVLVCYDAQGMPLTTLPFNHYSEYIDVPDVTAMVELMPEKPASNTDTFLHCNYMNVYSADGRVMAIHDLLLPVYQMVGWYEPVTVYADDGRTLDISPFQVGAYERVGWYSYETYLFRDFQTYYKSYKSSKNYKGMLDLVDAYLPDLENTKYASSLYAVRTEAIDLWRKSSGTPFAYTDYYISTSYGVPEATIYFTNVSYKPIIAFKTEFTCYDVFGGVEETYYDYYYCDDTYVPTAETYYYTWSLHGASSVSYISKPIVTEVVFSDYTKWQR